MALSVEISGVSYRMENNFSIQQQAGAVSSSDIVIQVLPNQDVPRSYSECTIYDDTTPIFWGIVQAIESPEFSSGFEARKYRLQLQSGEAVLNNRLVSEAFTNQTTTDIVNALFTGYIESEGITLGDVSDIDYTYKNFNCSFTKLYDVLYELATDCNGAFYISADKKFYFLVRESFIQMDAPEHITGLKIEEENGDLRTVQIVTGASEETSLQNVGQFYVAGQSAFLLGCQIKSIYGITINGTPAGVGVLGVDDEDTSKTFLYEVGSNTVTLNSNATTQPADGDLVVIVFIGYYEVVVTNVNDSLASSLASLSGTSGLIEQVYTDETIDNFADADARSRALLDAYGEREQTISCTARFLEDTELFLLWNFDLPDQRITGQYVITERNITNFGTENYWIRIKLRNKNFFQRYGTVLVSPTKQKGKDTKVYKSSNISDSISISDAYTFDLGGLVAYPTDGATFIDPGFDTFYPGY